MSREKVFKRKVNVSFPNIRFECVLCEKCCIQDDKNRRQIVLTVKDVEEISNKTGLKTEDFSNENYDEKYPFIMKLVEGRCFFLEAGGKCSIYSSRPLVCRFYPFVMQKVGGKYVFHADPSCPGLGKGEYLDRKYFEKLVEEAEECLGNFH
ncbi:MAG: YkgJ family cysteine cluster protein [Thermoproteota archaeon]